MIGWGRLFGGSVSPLENEAGEQGGRRRGGLRKSGGVRSRGERRRGEQEIFCIVRIVCAQEMGGRLFGDKILKGTCAEASCINGGQPMEE